MYRRFRRTTIISIGLAAFLIGLGLARTKLEVSGYLVLLSLALLIGTTRRLRSQTIVFVALFGLLFGWWRGGLFMQKLNSYDSLYDKNVTIQGVAATDAVYAANSPQLQFDLGHLQLIEPNGQKLVGKLSVRGFGEPIVYHGDTVQISGKLRTTLGSKQGRISYSQISVLTSDSSPINKLRRRFEAGMQSALPEPLASFGLGLLVGQRSTLSEGTTTALAAVGLTHIIAVSGYNLTIIIRGVRRFLRKRSKYQSTVIAGSLIILFLLFTGSSPSIVRAAIVSGLSLIAWYYGRTFKPILLLLLAAALTAGVNPVYIWKDIGWDLSFLAFFGVLVIAPLIAKRIFKKREAPAMTLVVIESFSAQIMALPIIMYTFGEVSIVALLANVLIVPLVPLAMLFSLGAGMSGMLLPSLAGWIAWPAKILMTYMLDLVTLMSRIPNALAQQFLNLWQMISIYGLILAMTFMCWGKTRTKNVKITE